MLWRILSVLFDALIAQLSKSGRYKDRCLDVIVETDKCTNLAKIAMFDSPSPEEVKEMIKKADLLIVRANDLIQKFPLPKDCSPYVIMILEKCRVMSQAYLDLYWAALRQEFPPAPKQEDIDLILDKVSEFGKESLTIEEKAMLAKF